MIFYFAFPSIEVFTKLVMGKLLLAGHLPNYITNILGGHIHTCLCIVFVSFHATKVVLSG